MKNENRKYKLSLSYDGTNYSGWQIQPNGTSIQELLQNAITIATKEPVKVIGSGRTDAGVHAKRQIAHVVLAKPIDSFKFLGSINGILPPDVRLNAIEEIYNGFHACHSAKGKIYHYHLHLDKVACPFNKLYHWHVLEKIDLVTLQKAAACFIGEHDFTTFANEAHKGSAARNAIRTIERIDVVEQPGGIRLEFEGNGFLYKMVRNIVGTLVTTASGKRSVESITTLLTMKDRRLADNAAPPKGLFLMDVKY